MTLTLSIRNVDRLENGVPTEFVLHRRGATIGRAPTCDWSLPDPHRYISSHHCEIAFRDEGYWLTDVSTNGTFVNGAPERLQGERRIEQGDLILIGHYEVISELSGAAAAGAEAPAEQPQYRGWESWAPGAGTAPPPPSGRDDEWAAPPVAPAPSGQAGSWEPAESRGAAGKGAYPWGSTSSPPPPPPASGWAPSHNASAPSVWTSETEPAAPASQWSSAAPDRPPPPKPDDVWGRIAEGNVVDWARGGFGQPQPDRSSDPLGLERTDPGAALPKAQPRPQTAAPQTAPRGRAAAAPPAAATGPADMEALVRAFLHAAGISREEVKAPPQDIIDRAGRLVSRLVAGLVLLVEARARAKAQMGAESTRLEFDGNNPIKFARAPEQALTRLLSNPERGFMDSEKAVEDAFYDLQSHQMATLKAMQGALRATLERFSPDAIRKRAGGEGFLTKVLPAARDAALWQSYEREFGGVARGSDEAFMDIFAKEFRKAYEEQSRSRR